MINQSGLLVKLLTLTAVLVVLKLIKWKKIFSFWFRRDLRLDDNLGLNAALSSGLKVIPIFIFDTEIINKLEKMI